MRQRAQQSRDRRSPLLGALSFIEESDHFLTESGRSVKNPTAPERGCGKWHKSGWSPPPPGNN